MSKKVKILYGILGGEHSGKRLIRALRQAGFEIVQTASEADIILAHSAGCLWVPPRAPKQKVVLVDPPYWPEKTIRERAKVRARSNFRFYQHAYPLRIWLARNLWGVYYGIADFKRTMHIIRAIPAFDLERLTQSRPIVLVRNQYDDWLTSDLADLRRASPNLQLVTLPGDHDDFNYNPKPYVDLLQSLAKE